LGSLRWRLIAVPVAMIAALVLTGAQSSSATAILPLPTSPSLAMPTAPSVVPTGANVNVVQNGIVGMGTARSVSSGTFSAQLVPAWWCTASYEAWDTTNPDTANAASIGSCGGPIAAVTANVALFAANGQETVGYATDYEPNSSYAQAITTDYCDYDPGGCWGDEPFSDWIGQTFYTRQGWNGGLDNCLTAGDYMFCSTYPGAWNWP
jgi:hypothetical protein